MSTRTTAPVRDTTGTTATLSAEEFAALFARDCRLLLCLAASVLGRASGAEDVLQESAIVALSKLPEFERGTSFAAWVGRIVRNVAHNHRRKAGRAVGGSGDAVDSAVDRSGMSTAHEPTRAGVERLALDGNAFDDRLQRALAQLSDTARACLLLKTVLELEYREIAALLEIPEGTAMSHVHRAREALRQSLGSADEGGGS